MTFINFANTYCVRYFLTMYEKRCWKMIKNISQPIRKGWQFLPFPLYNDHTKRIKWRIWLEDGFLGILDGTLRLTSSPSIRIQCFMTKTSPGSQILRCPYFLGLNLSCKKLYTWILDGNHLTLLLDLNSKFNINFSLVKVWGLNVIFNLKVFYYVKGKITNTHQRVVENPMTWMMVVPTTYPIHVYQIRNHRHCRS